MTSKALTRTGLQRVVSAIDTLFPPQYADSRWDNTGLLIDSSVQDGNVDGKRPSVLLAVDLTSAVAQEAIDKKVDLIIAYHPFIFRNWSRITPQSNPQHQSAINLIQNNISVHCPHTAVDASINGVNDYLVKILTRGDYKLNKSIESINTSPVAQDEPLKERLGFGRYVELNNTTTALELIHRIKESLKLKNCMVSLPDKYDSLDSFKINSVALCAGSGSGVFKELSSEQDPDFYFTGELSHHEVLALKERGKCVVLVNHSNSERNFIQTELKDKLQELLDDKVDIIVSAKDRDPLQFV
ncbi:hypothetical protein TBLA_0C04980 [Henningerozyma blattae CBS 6284]|uniref:YbgI/family dinuclear metal center protein n=1 Tax=Henningerozyma blattae (strain ATCC 34711 / CBS 6284 / DSM 70876 / NBRC 10599 / NRRL Y-10934 / UCD 77-7) TaxID=1071380 RepID=I2H1P2_HENB6|nr:hypothetical protein TBLA_0C04980 [Tetrapisispora blattae CBS 6284]CCH60294.1 hypothetical protein TBLA_0C04980 [Tetrapisispora blattae CBS 6284]